jgi:apolipoprotein N-acyltransferase
MLTASFPNLGSPLIAWFALVPLMAALRNCSLLDSLRWGYLFGITHFITLIYWIIPCLKTYGMIPLYLSLIVLILFAAYLALFIAGFAAAVNWVCKDAKLLIFIAPAFWVAIEYARAHLFTGFPWELLGYSQFRILPLIQVADALGVYGVSFLVVMGNISVFLIYLSLSGRSWKGNMLEKKQIVISLSCFFIILTGVWGYGVWRMGIIEKAVAVSPSKRVSVIQGNISQQMKWDPAFQTATIDRYIALSRKEAETDPHLIVWPETAMPFYFGYNLPLTSRVLRGIQPTQTDYIISSPGFDRKEDRVEYRNRAFILKAGQRNIADTYDKAHLVPFGEYVPLKKWLPFLGKLVAQVGDFSAGEKGANLKWGEHRIGMLICYELIFPYLSREATRNRADFLVNITNDAWYGRTSAPFQHFSMAVFRAVENRRALARAANTGISGFVDPTGKIMAASPIFEKAALTAEIPLMHVATLYSRFGDWFSLICVIIFLATVILRFFYKR